MSVDEQSRFEQTVIRLGSEPAAAQKPPLRAHPMLAALRRAGTRHVYGDSADVGEIGALVRTGDALARRFDDAGFGDVFYAPTAAEWQELRQGKLPVFGAELTGRLALDTLYTLLADADFEKYQEEMDALLLPRLG